LKVYPLQFATMAVKKVTEVNKKPEGKKIKFNFSFWDGVLPKTTKILSFFFYLIWIVIGVFLIFQGVYSAILSRKAPTQTQQVADTQAPSEVDLPGIGKVNVKCVQGALSQESIQKILQEGNTQSLQGEEKTNFEKCVVGPVASPQESPKPTS